MPRKAAPSSVGIADVAAARGVSESGVRSALVKADAESAELGGAWPRGGIPQPARRRPRVEWDRPGPIDTYMAAGARNQRPAELDDVEWLRREYVERGRSTYDLAKELGVSKDTVRVALGRLGLPIRSGPASRPGPLDGYSLAELDAARVEHGSMEATAKALGTTHMTLRDKIRRLSAEAEATSATG